jgi:hypothetical protein
MKKLLLCTAVSAATIMMSQTAQADRVKGSARADFANDELIVPCVVINGLGGAADGQYFDIILDRRGNSFNYELSFAEPEDTAICEELANYAIFIDDDEEESDEDESDDDDSDDVADDDSDDDDSDDSDDDDSNDDSEDVANLFPSCEVRHEEAEQVRSKVKVKAKDLIPGDYYAIVTSGENSIQSEARSISDDEVEFEFDSDADDVLEGAEAIEVDFIQEETVTAELVDAATDEVLLTETVSCLVKNK